MTVVRKVRIKMFPERRGRGALKNQSVLLSGDVTVLCTFVGNADCCCKYYAPLSLMLFWFNSVMLKIFDDKDIDAAGGDFPGRIKYSCKQESQL